MVNVSVVARPTIVSDAWKVCVVPSVPANAKLLLTVSVLPSVPDSVKLLVTAKVLALVSVKVPVVVLTVKPFTLVGVIAPSVKVMAGVVVAVATEPDTPLAVVTDTDVTVPELPDGTANVPSPRKKVVVLLGGVGTAPPTVAVMVGSCALVATVHTPAPLAYKIPVNPVTLRVVNAPVLGVVAPIGVLSIALNDVDPTTDSPPPKIVRPPVVMTTLVKVPLEGVSVPNVPLNDPALNVGLSSH